MANQEVIDRPKAETSRLWRAARTTILLVAGAVASVMMVEVPRSSTTDGQAAVQSPVPVSDEWIPLGQDVSSRSKTG